MSAKGIKIYGGKFVKTLTLQLGDKLYTASRITAWQSREALAINKTALELAKKAKSIGDDADENDAAAIIDLMGEIATRRSNLICEVYSGKFTVDELEKNLTTEEIAEHMNQITFGIMGIVQKNG